MKKLVALLVTMALLLTFAMTATAEQTIDFRAMLSEEELALGNFIQVSEDIPAEIWIRGDAFVESDVPEERKTGLECLVLTYREGTDDETVIISILPNDTGTFDDYVAALKADEETFPEVEECVVNGIRAVAYKCTEEDGSITVYLTYEVTDYAYLSIQYRLTDNDSYVQDAGLIASSVSLIDDSDG